MIAESEGIPTDALGSRILPFNSINGISFMHKTTQVISFTLPKQMLADLDKIRGDVPRSRYLLRIIESKLQDMK